MCVHLHNWIIILTVVIVRKGFLITDFQNEVKPAPLGKKVAWIKKALMENHEANFRYIAFSISFHLAHGTCQDWQLHIIYLQNIKIQVVTGHYLTKAKVTKRPRISLPPMWFQSIKNSFSWRKSYLFLFYLLSTMSSFSMWNPYTTRSSLNQESAENSLEPPSRNHLPGKHFLSNWKALGRKKERFYGFDFHFLGGFLESLSFLDVAVSVDKTQ